MPKCTCAGVSLSSSCLQCLDLRTAAGIACKSEWKIERRIQRSTKKIYWQQQQFNIWSLIWEYEISFAVIFIIVAWQLHSTRYLPATCLLPSRQPAVHPIEHTTAHFSPLNAITTFLYICIFVFILCLLCWAVIQTIGYKFYTNIHTFVRINILVKWSIKMKKFRL